MVAEGTAGEILSRAELRNSQPRKWCWGHGNGWSTLGDG